MSNDTARPFVHLAPLRTLSCGCCTAGCVCWNHRDEPNGHPVATCEYHAKWGHPRTTSPAASHPTE